MTSRLSGQTTGIQIDSINRDGIRHEPSTPRSSPPGLAGGATLSAPLWAAPMIVELSAEASRPRRSTVVRATVSAEASGTTPGDLSRRVNKPASPKRSRPQNPTRQSRRKAAPPRPTQSTPRAARSNRDLANALGAFAGVCDTAALSELLGKLQASLGVSNLLLQPSAETRKKVEEQAVVDAIAEFKTRAKVIAGALGMSYRIKQLSVSTSGRSVQPMFRGAAKTMAMDAAADARRSGRIAGQRERFRPDLVE